MIAVSTYYWPSHMRWSGTPTSLHTSSSHEVLVTLKKNLESKFEFLYRGYHSNRSPPVACSLRSSVELTRLLSYTNNLT